MDLSRVATATLEALRRKLAAGRLIVPLRADDLGEAAALAGMDAAAATAVISGVLAERSRTPTPPELVWTGPGDSAEARRTSQVVERLFEEAQESVLLAGYAFDHGATILRPLHTAMQKRGVAATLVVHFEQSSADAGLATFLHRNWPFGPPLPALYYDPRPLLEQRANLHAKCIVVDDRVAFVTSANFTDRGQHRNVEVGAVIRDVAFARRLAGQFKNAMTAGHFQRWEPGPEATRGGRPS